MGNNMSQVNREPDATIVTAVMPGSYRQPQSSHELMTEGELIEFLRIPEVSKARDYHNVIENLQRMRDLPRIHICGQPLYPRKAVLEWISNHTVTKK